LLLLLRDLDLLLDALGVRLRRFALRRLEDLLDLRLGALGVRDRRLEERRDALRLDDLLLGAIGVLLRFAFFLEGDFEPLVLVRARFLIPISLFRFSSISALYSSLAVTHDR